MKILVTGSASGLGRYLKEEFNAVGFTRADSVRDLKSSERFDMIVHCAFSSERNPSETDIYSYIEDNLLLTYELTQLDTRKFVYISSIDVYPQNGFLHSEDEVISLQADQTDYGRIKLFSEAIVRKRCRNHLIIRPGLLLGKYTRNNNLVRLLTDASCQLSLSADSSFNCVTYHSIWSLIREAWQRDFSGIYNAVSNDRIVLKELAESGDRKIEFGRYPYKTAQISNLKAAAVCNEFNRSSLEAIRDYLNHSKH